VHAHGAKPLGILPIGALGVAFYFHLTAGQPETQERVAFLSRRAGDGNERWREESTLAIETPTGRLSLPLAGKLAGSLPDAASSGRMPEIVLVCTNPDQLFDVISDYTAAVEIEHRSGRLRNGTSRLPLLILCANGIYFQRIRRSFIELLEESTLLGRLPDLWPDIMPIVVGKLMRGVTIQTSLRSGSGSAAVYRPGPPGRTLLTGGDQAARAAAAKTLADCGGWFEDAGHSLPTRIEFDKALVNLAINAFGQLAAIDEQGHFQLLTVGEIGRPSQHGRILELVEAVMHVGRGVGVYTADESPRAVFEQTIKWMSPASHHVPSSLQWLQQRISSGTLGLGLTPTEKWLLEPLQHYARSLGDSHAIRYFEGLEHELNTAIERAIAAQKSPSR
jgi:hypothetical protein